MLCCDSVKRIVPVCVFISNLARVGGFFSQRKAGIPNRFVVSKIGTKSEICIPTDILTLSGFTLPIVPMMTRPLSTLRSNFFVGMILSA